MRGCTAMRGCSISTHALREEGDTRWKAGNTPRTMYFYPRPPRGGRRGRKSDAGKRWLISTHALREEGDHSRWITVVETNGFLPTPSARRATG